MDFTRNFIIFFPLGVNPRIPLGLFFNDSQKIVMVSPEYFLNIYRKISKLFFKDLIQHLFNKPAESYF